MTTENQYRKCIRVLIVDDEERARDLLERLLARIPGTEIAAKAASADEAVEMVIAPAPDLVFLDIQMPDKSGLQMVDYLKKYMLDTTVIFVTAHAEFAIDAIRLSAFDYLLKPVVMEQLNESIMRFKAEKWRFRENRRVILPDSVNKGGKLKFNTRTGYVVVLPGEIMYCEADVNYTTFHFGNGNREVITVNLGRVEEMLAPWPFYRISRSVLINTAFLIKADRQLKKCLLVKGNEKIWLDIPLNHIRELEKIMDKP
jgi:DNA-binding LytR/AlgR family response regulator